MGRALLGALFAGSGVLMIGTAVFGIASAFELDLSRSLALAGATWLGGTGAWLIFVGALDELERRRTLK